MTPFHLAVPVDDLTSARHFYGEILGFPEGRSSDCWIDWDFQGHQFVTHLGSPIAADRSAVDGDKVPNFHFGLVLEMAEWKALRDRLKAAKATFLLDPKIRFEGEPGEQATMFVRDPAGNALEFKGFADMSRLFTA